MPVQHDGDDAGSPSGAELPAHAPTRPGRQSHNRIGSLHEQLRRARTPRSSDRVVSARDEIAVAIEALQSADRRLARALAGG